MDLVAAADLEEAAAVVAQAERGDMPESNHPVLQSNFPVLGSESTSYFTPEKIAPLEMTNNPSIGLTPLAETIHPTFETPGFNSVDSSAFTPGIGLY